MKSTRKEELERIFKDVDAVKDILAPLIDDVVFLETHLKELRELPFIRVNANNPTEQKATPAAKQYKEFLQQYNNCMKIMITALRKNSAEEESPLRAFLNGVNADD